MVEFRQLVISSLLIALFTFTLIGSGVLMQVNNGVNNTILEDPVINNTFNNLTGSLSSRQGIAQTQLEGFEEEAPQIGTNIFLFSSFVGAGKTFISSLNLMYNLVFGLIIVKLGLGTGLGLVIIGTLLTILLVTIIFLIYKVFKIGV